MPSHSEPSHRYALQVSLNAVACDVQVNDVPVVRNYSTSRTDFTLPVSDFIVPGTNTLKIRSLIDISEGGASATRATATLLATPFGQSDWLPLMRVETRAVPSAEGEATSEPLDSPLGAVSPQSSEYDAEIMLLETARAISLTSNVPQWGWTTSAANEKNDTTKESLIAWYRHLFEIVDARDTGMMSELLHEKTYELSQATGLSQEETAFELGLLGALENDTLTRVPVDWDALKIELAGYGHLARLYDPQEGSLLVFLNDLEIRHTFDFWLRRDGSDWRIAR